MWIRAAGEDSITKGEYYVSRAWQDIVGGGAQMKYEELSLSFRRLQLCPRQGGGPGW